MACSSRCRFGLIKFIKSLTTDNQACRVSGFISFQKLRDKNTYTCTIQGRVGLFANIAYTRLSLALTTTALGGRRSEPINVFNLSRCSRYASLRSLLKEYIAPRRISRWRPPHPRSIYRLQFQKQKPPIALTPGVPLLPINPLPIPIATRTISDS